MLRLRLLLLICGTALAQLGFINPPPRRPSSTLLFYSQNSEERLEWEAQYSAYTIYLWQVLPEGEAVMLGPVFNTTNGTRHMFYDWAIDISSETLHVSTLFYLALAEVDAAHLSASQNFFVSDSAVDQDSGDASPSVASSSTSTAALTTMSLLSSLEGHSSSTTAQDTLSSAATLSSSSSKSRASSSATPTAVASSSAVGFSPSSDIQETLETSGASPSAKTTADATAAVATAPAAASVRPPQENDMGIWIGISLGLGLPLLATCAATAVCARRGRKRVLQL